MPHHANLDRIAPSLDQCLGPKGWSHDPFILQQHEQDWLKHYHGRALLVAYPKTTDQVAAVIKICRDQGLPIVPQGGNTGLAGGATPDETGHAVVLSLTRMNQIRAVDPEGATLIAEAGCILRDVQVRAAAAKLFFPLSLGAEGSCTIGGNIATNAGGINVLRYGNMRNLVLGLEVVLADGSVWQGLRSLHKDNTGYDLKQLFIGSEGTLGVITAAVLKLFPSPGPRVSLMTAIDDLTMALKILNLAQTIAPGRLSACEIMDRACLQLAGKMMPGLKLPFGKDYPWVMLLEWTGADLDAQSDLVETSIAKAIETGLARDAIVAQSAGQAQSFWHLREAIVEAQRRAGPLLKHDIALPVGRIPAFVDECQGALQRSGLSMEAFIFGHLGDGNLHYNFLLPADQPPLELTRILHDMTHSYAGSISAEHGVGQYRREEIARYKDSIELSLMQKLKLALDPENILNPGKVLPDGSERRDVL